MQLDRTSKRNVAVKWRPVTDTPVEQPVSAKPSAGDPTLADALSLACEADAVPADPPDEEASGLTKVQSVDEFLKFLSDEVPSDTDHWYRGHASDGWFLSASVFRTANRTANEVIMLKRFIQEARRHHPDVPTDLWEITFLAQHHAVPTRVLDWSESPLVGLYFACLDHLDDPSDNRTARPGRLWILKPTVLNTKQGLVFGARDLPMFGINSTELDKYSPFGGSIHHEKGIAALAPRTFNRINAQWGAFTISTRADPLELLPDHDEFLTALDIPIAAKPDLRQQLARLGISDRTIFMDLFRLGISISDEYS